MHEPDGKTPSRALRALTVLRHAAETDAGAARARAAHDRALAEAEQRVRDLRATEARQRAVHARQQGEAPPRTAGDAARQHAWVAALQGLAERLTAEAEEHRRGPLALARAVEEAAARAHGEAHRDRTLVDNRVQAQVAEARLAARARAQAEADDNAARAWWRARRIE